MHFLADGWARFALIEVVNCAVVCLIMWFFGTNAEQRSKLITFAASVPVRLSRKAAVLGRVLPGEERLERRSEAPPELCW